MPDATHATEGRSLFAATRKVYPRKASGHFRTLKTRVNFLLLTLYFVAPWIRWDRGPGAADQAILLDMSGRRGYFFGIEIWPQEVYYLTGILILGAVGLFFATALFGRVWCGFTCIQTVFTDVFVAVERAVEGDRNARIKLDKQPLSAAKAGGKLLKNAIWLAIALATSWTWLIYFSDAVDSTRALFAGETSGWMLSMWGVFTASTFLFAGYAREQVCIYMCPWPRFQSAMFDEDSLIVTYEAWRGEPRGKAPKGGDFSGRGDCIDCGMCVQVCPTGIDIRNGSQLACIGCALCIDACNGVMAKVGRPPNLISYDSVANQVARAKGKPTKIRLVRPRTLVYGAILLIVAAAMLAVLTMRHRETVNVLHERSPLYVRMSDGSIRNGYTVKVLNMRREPQTFRFSLAGAPEANLNVVGYGARDAAAVDLPVEGDTVGTFRVYVTVPRGAKTDHVEMIFESAATGARVVERAPFAVPGS
ncbi:Nitrogen fixation protein FixG [uncultured Alphaproteobacteria bacterium]|uniref:Nitrogen fixation protein FixG n=1 Tax=uncultured Alphaproteobacteria bacterium TaxID=91750 RepID=A0A212KKW7_9PROT|nr:Nitrogen fixation protein FixG [uncultured Alphaproteobacteria bacterium]